MTNFKTTTLRQIKLWTWAAAVLPMTSLAGIFFIWTFGTNTWVSIVMIVAETIMFSIAVIWWWWAMYTMKNIVDHWGETKDKVTDVLNDIKDIKTIVREITDKDK